MIHDIVIRNGMIYDGSGGPPFAGEVAIDGDHIVYRSTARGPLEYHAQQ